MMTFFVEVAENLGQPKGGKEEEEGCREGAYIWKGKAKHLQGARSNCKIFFGGGKQRQPF